MITGQDVDITEIRNFLAPQDPMVRKLVSDKISIAHPRAEFTCEWFGTHVKSFIRSPNKVLLVTGKAESGKSVLSSWIMELFQGSLEQRPYDVLMYRIGKCLVTSIAWHVMSRH